MDSIHNVTDAILKDEGVHEDDVIVIHDAVRPLVTEKFLNDSIDAAGTYGACVCGLPAVDTMLYSEDGKVVTTIPERSKLFNGQAPTVSLTSVFGDAGKSDRGTAGSDYRNFPDLHHE